MHQLTAAIGLVFLLAQGAALGQDLKAAQACTPLSDDTSRLACYDAAFGLAKPNAAQRSDAGKTDVVEKFGDNGQLHPDLKADLPKNLTVQVQQVTPLADGQYRLALDNGQVWRTTEADWKLVFKANDRITIWRMRSGGYQISLEGRGASVGARRIK